MKNLPRIEINSLDTWRQWLRANGDRLDSVWLIIWKKGRGPHVAYDDLVDEALCFGWIDSLPRRFDDFRSMLLMSPRRIGSGWSSVNKKRIERLTASGRITDRGNDAIARAKHDGSWTRLDGAGALIVPADLAAALERESSRQHFDAFPPSARRGILEWIELAKRPETRTRRIENTASAAARNEWIGQKKQSP